MLLEIHNLEVSYGAIKALQGVSLQIDRGEIVTLIGSNGAGKTTLLRTISGLIEPDAGEITLDIRQVRFHWSDCRRIKLCDMASVMRPKGRQVFAKLTVRENLLLGAISTKVAIADPVRHRTGLHALSRPG